MIATNSKEYLQYLALSAKWNEWSCR
uniref:Uncharacterized protein n=1 Tax=Anguilla anguilla TaxID=7936 RepID=A0A0E9QZH5_ANGAN